MARVDYSPVVSQAQARIVGLLNAAHDPDTLEQARAKALEWYRNAHAHARTIAERAGCTVEQAAAIIAVFSPQTYWSQNLKYAYAYINGEKAGRYPSKMMPKADAILALRGEEARDWDKLRAILGGPKVSAFAHNIAYPDTSDEVTLDLWMARVFGIEEESLRSRPLYRALADMMRSLAAYLGMAAHALQAMLWILLRERAD